MKHEEIKELIELFGESKLGKVHIKKKDFEIEMEKSAETTVTVPAVQAAVPVPNALPETAETAAQQVPSEVKNKIVGEMITSPMVGTLYASPSPDSPPFVKIGDRVKRGDVLCILEAMKIMNELEAEYDCKILDILVENGEPVEYDKPLFVVERI
jgi:acetyl-CoA carboxylase biotin carboxyl carrier protein